MVLWFEITCIPTNTQTHTAHSGASTQQAYINIYLHHMLGSPQELPLLHWIIKWIILWYQKFTFHNVFSFQKLFTDKSDISVDYMLKTRHFLLIVNNTDRNGVNKQNTHTHTQTHTHTHKHTHQALRERDNTGKS